MSQQSSTVVDTGVIYSAQQIERSDKMNRHFDGGRPLWTPSPEEIAQLESKLTPFLEDVANGKRREAADYYWRAPSQTKAIVARLESYKRQYFGFTERGKKWILVNRFCEEHWCLHDGCIGAMRLRLIAPYDLRRFVPRSRAASKGWTRHTGSDQLRPTSSKRSMPWPTRPSSSKPEAASA